jgi:hypothetical protein
MVFWEANFTDLRTQDFKGQPSDLFKMNWVPQKYEAALAANE